MPQRPEVIEQAARDAGVPYSPTAVRQSSTGEWVAQHLPRTRIGWAAIAVLLAGSGTGVPVLTKLLGGMEPDNPAIVRVTVPAVTRADAIQIADERAADATIKGAAAWRADIASHATVYTLQRQADTDQAKRIEAKVDRLVDVVDGLRIALARRQR